MYNCSVIKVSLYLYRKYSKGTMFILANKRCNDMNTDALVLPKRLHVNDELRPWAAL
jgi:hypothetical protein